MTRVAISGYRESSDTRFQAMITLSCMSDKDKGGIFAKEGFSFFVSRLFVTCVLCRICRDGYGITRRNRSNER